MGDIKRKRKLFVRPRQLFDRVRMDEENVLIKEYGLKVKREIWKAKSIISKFRSRAKSLISSEDAEKKIFFDKLNKIGIIVKDISDVLALTEKDLLDRRLQTIVHKKGLANTPKQARQLIVHKNILIDGNVVNTPSFMVDKDLESKISLKVKKVKVKKEVAPANDEANEETVVEDVEEVKGGVKEEVKGELKDKVEEVKEEVKKE